MSLFWVLHLYFKIGMDVRAFTNFTCVQLKDLCLRVTSTYLKSLIREKRRRKNFICAQLCIPIYVYTFFSGYFLN